MAPPVKQVFRIDFDALKRQVESSHSQPVDLDPQQLEAKKLLMKIDLERDERIQILDLRKQWAANFKSLMWLVFIFEVALAVGVGFKIVSFQDEWFVRIIVIGGFGQLLSMPYLVATFLFNKESISSKGVENK